MTITIKEKQPMLKGITTGLPREQACAFFWICDQRRSKTNSFGHLSVKETLNILSVCPASRYLPILGPFLLHAFLKTQPRDTAHILPLENGDDAERNSAEHKRVAAQERVHSQSNVVCPH